MAVKGLTQAALALALGMSEGRVSQLKAQGMPTDSVEAAQAWREAYQSIAMRKRTQADSVGSTQPASVNFDPPQAFAPPSSDMAGQDYLGEDFQMARTRREIAEANRAEMLEAKMRREMINVSVVERQLAIDYATTRDALMQIPARIAPLLASESDTAAIQTLLDAEIHQALSNLAGTADQAKRAEGAFD